MTPAGIEPATSRFVAQRLNHCATAVPLPPPRGDNTNINSGLDTIREKENRTSKKNVDGSSTSGNDNKKFRTRSLEKQRGMAFGFRKTVTVVKKPDRQIIKAYRLHDA